jgi:DNA-binding NarL/FixJ family response regulator
LRELIETHEDLKVLGEATNGEEAVLLSVALKPAVVVIDVHLPLLSGVAATTLIKTTRPFATVIGLTAGDPGDDATAMTREGAAAVINKSDAMHALHPAILNAVKHVKHPG